MKEQKETVTENVIRRFYELSFKYKDHIETTDFSFTWSNCYKPNHSRCKAAGAWRWPLTSI